MCLLVCEVLVLQIRTIFPRVDNNLFFALRRYWRRITCYRLSKFSIDDIIFRKSLWFLSLKHKFLCIDFAKAIAPSRCRFRHRGHNRRVNIFKRGLFFFLHSKCHRIKFSSIRFNRLVILFFPSFIKLKD